MKKKITKIIIICSVFIVASLCIYSTSRPKLTTIDYKVKNYDLASIDSLILEDNRHCGWVNLERFIGLTSQQGTRYFDDQSCVKREKDSVVISINPTRQQVFFGTDDGQWWRKDRNYANLPITFPTESSFKARVKQEDGVEYIYIPYQILVSLAEYSEPENVENTRTYEVSENPEITIKSKEDVKRKIGLGKKIQNEGIVFSHVADILSNKRYANASQREQMEILWRHAKDNWVYIHDPHLGRDTWRSAEETINSYYYSNSQRYSGDCDDFAILMASFARQIGYESWVVTVIGDEGGHAYALFKDGNKEIPLDWFSDEFGGPPYQGVIIGKHTDI